ncbi:MAG TPA: AmmeMemoRadiSam system radical SAM enzyme, partial [Candidatus Ozemobacteraceae bacterium]|nr:AmmeMemoRadiSam system radical SAM enzyme [Candidatus Ozemobacteraceae bacterium]
MHRRSFLQSCAGACFLSLAPAGILNTGAWAALPATPREAEYYEVLPDGRIHCLLCPNGCVRGEGERSQCRVREPRGGKYYSLVYANPCVLALDPVEKCPLYHFPVPGNAFSIATAGCNLGCRYCQNWQFSQKPPEETRNFALQPEDVVAKAREYHVGGIAFFYTEPTIYIEYMKDVARQARKAGLVTVMVTAGYLQPKPLEDLLDCIDAFTVGLKGFSQEYYQTVIKGSFPPVLETLKRISAAKKHLEVVTLLVPTLNDQEASIKSEADWFAENLGPDVPLHFTRFNPQFQLKNLPPTPVSVLDQARKTALNAGLRYVYTGNVPGH